MGESHRSRGTSTSSFGVSKRENHDASALYERFTAPELSDATEMSSRRGWAAGRPTPAHQPSSGRALPTVWNSPEPESAMSALEPTVRK